jgi:2-methylisocitrate lyase-like PEP mutase family enzyme
VRNGTTASLRTLLQGGELVVAPGVYDGLSARIAAAAGFEALYISGGAIARSMGYPDIGLVTLTEMAKRIEEIREASAKLPLIADADTGYGNALNVMRTVRMYERIGVSALHLEDQVAPKRCGHYEKKEVISAAEMVGKIRAAVDARESDELMIIARTDTRSVMGLDEALARGRSYRRAGADMIFVEAPQSVAEIERIPQELDAPLLINMFEGGKTPLVHPDRLGELGYQLMIVPSDLQRAAIRAMDEVARAIRSRGNSAEARDSMVTFAQREEVVGKAETERLQDLYLDLDKLAQEEQSWRS